MEKERVLIHGSLHQRVTFISILRALMVMLHLRVHLTVQSETMATLGVFPVFKLFYFKSEK